MPKLQGNGQDQQGWGQRQGMMLGMNGGAMLVDKKLERMLKKKRARQEKEQRAVERRRSVYFKRKLTREKDKFRELLERFKRYSTSPNTMTLVQVTLDQVNRLPSVFGIKHVLIGIGLFIIAAAAIYLNVWWR